ncbi:MAG: cadmium-translocating P-type ATPase [Anaerolineae bacterium]|nr:cadmium-translocating P-type ATPase [Anaerolineae bacterium]
MTEQVSTRLSTSSQTANEAAQPSGWRLLVQRERLEPTLVVITALAIAGSLLAEKLEAPALVVLVLNIISYIAGGWFGVQAGIESLLHKEINVDLLMVLAAAGAATVNQWREGAILLFLFSLSNVLQAYAMDRSRNAIKALLKLRPNEATIRQDGSLIVVPVESLNLRDVVVIRPGERFPIDGRVIDGESTVDQSPITGESMPVSKGKGDDVFAGTVNQNGSLDVQVTRPANDTTLARIIKMVEDAQGRRASTQRFLDEFEQKYAMFVIGAVLLFIFIPPLLPGGPTFNDNFYRAMVLMTVASPCALVISTPASILSAIANAARRGILFKGGAHLEQMATIKAIAFDKTGTITTGRPAVTEISTYNGVSRDELLRVAAALESRSEHPVAKAVVERARADALHVGEPDSFEAVPGLGVRGTVNGISTIIGNERLMEQEKLIIPADLMAERTQLESEGKTVLLVYQQGWLGAIAVADELRPNAAEVLQSIRAAGVEHIVILTGDNERVAKAIARRVGADEMRANLLPEDKVTAVAALKEQYGPTAMVGDGVNDAPALASATIGIAMGAAGTDVALETADVVLMADDLSNIAYAMHLSRKARRVVVQNIAFSLGVIAVLVISALGFHLPLPFGVVGHEGSTIIVVSNGLRLLTYRGNPTASGGKLVSRVRSTVTSLLL